MIYLFLIDNLAHSLQHNGLITTTGTRQFGNHEGTDGTSPMQISGSLFSMMNRQNSLDFFSQKSQYRKDFSNFLKLIKSNEGLVKLYSAYLAKCLNIKVKLGLSLEEISELFERQYFKYTKDHQRNKKFWSDDEILLLLILLASLCAINSEDYTNLVSNVLTI